MPQNTKLTREYELEMFLFKSKVNFLLWQTYKVKHVTNSGL